MATVLCGISGIEFKVDHLSIHLQSREYAHPVFFLPAKKLPALYSKYQQGEMNSIDSYLTFLAFLNSTNLIEWRVPAARTNLTDSIIANNFESLVFITEKMLVIPSYENVFSKIAITPDTKNLANVDMWIANWELILNDYLSGYVEERKRKEISEIESKLEKLFYSSERSETLLSAKLADWADKAGSFPRFPVSIGSNLVIPCNEYWKQIIRKCQKSESIISIPSADLDELLSHCEENIEAGTIWGHELFEILRKGKANQSNFLGLGDFTFSIIPSDTSVETANKIAIIQNAPEAEPQRVNYPSQFAYIKAKLAYDMAQNSKS